MTDATAMPLYPQPLTNSVFAPYGEVVEHDGAEGRNVLSVPFQQEDSGLTFSMWVNRLDRQAASLLPVALLERHPYSAQTFIPLSPSRCLVVVGLPDADGGVDLTTLQAFVTNGKQGVSYRPAIWHFAFTSLDSAADVAVIMGRTGRGDDTQLAHLTTDVQVCLGLER